METKEAKKGTPRRTGRRLDLSNEDRMWYGKNTKPFGGEFFLGLMSSGSDASIRIPERDRARVAALLESLAARLRGHPAGRTAVCLALLDGVSTEDLKRIAQRFPNDADATRRYMADALREA